MSDDLSADLVVVGGGPGGYVAAIRAAQLGLDTIVVDDAELGGVCLNEGCVPSKALIHDARELADDHRRGLVADDGVAPRFAESLQHRTKIMAKLRTGIGSLLDTNGVAHLRGRGRFVEPGRLQVTTDGEPQTVAFAQAIVATGSEAIVPADIGYDGTFVVTAREVLALDEPPARVVVVGGGYIGLELASALVRFGSSVTVIEAMDRLVPAMEPELTTALGKHLRADGIDVRLSTTVRSAADGTVVVERDGERSEIDADLVVVAVGRRPRTADIGLDTLGAEVDAAGHVVVDDRLATTAPGVFAIGDVTAGPALAHRASAQGKVAAEAAAGRPATFDPAAIPAVVFTTPEMASVGLTVAEALDAGVAEATQVKFPLAANARGLVEGGTGFGLLVFDAATGLVLGAHLIGPSVGELIGTAALAIEMGAVVDDVAGTIFPHPTISELYGELGDIAQGLPIHTPPSARR